jgi:hypothetical protein
MKEVIIIRQLIRISVCSDEAWRSTLVLLSGERCNRIFRNQQKNGLALVQEILEECKSYAK